jgi:hypothetical protein
MRTAVLRLAALALAVVCYWAIDASGVQEKPKYSISEVMKEAHGGKMKLVDKVASGKASKEEAEKLVELYTALGQNKPPKGDEADWKKRTDALVEAAKLCCDGDKEGGKKLKAAAACKGCHDAHK